LHLLVLQGKQIQKNLTFKIETKTKQIGSLTVQREILKLLPLFCVDPFSSQLYDSRGWLLFHSPTTSLNDTEG